MKRVFALILTTVLMLTSISACAIETRDSQYFGSYGASLSKLGGGDIRITFSCDAVGTASQLGVSSFSVYRYLSTIIQSAAAWFNNHVAA